MRPHNQIGLLLPLVYLSLASQISKRAAVNDCLTEAKVPQLDPASDAFSESIEPYNLRLQFVPVGLAVPDTVEQVQAAVSCGVQNNVTVSARGGGHSYVTNGLGGEDGHLVISMEKFNTTNVDTTTGIATVGSGSLVGEIAVALYNHSQLAMAHGTCPSVGIAGLTLHGGYGLSSRAHGLTLDNLAEAQVVLANSSVVVASETENPELFWALRGAGSSFGIVPTFKFRTFEAPATNVAFQYDLSDFNKTELENALVTLQDFTIEEQPAEMDMRIFLRGYNAEMRGIYHGPLADFNATMQPLLKKLGNPPSGSKPKVMGWIDSLKNDAYGSLLPDRPMHANFYAKSLMPPKLSSDAISALVDYYFTNATKLSSGTSFYLLIDFYGGASSAITQIPPDATSYVHRSTIFKMQFFDEVIFADTYPSDGFKFLDGWVAAIASGQGVESAVELGMYANYADSGLTADEAHRAYWGDNYQHLSELKRVFDPDGVFMNPQGVGP